MTLRELIPHNIHFLSCQTDKKHIPNRYYEIGTIYAKKLWNATNVLDWLYIRL